MIVAVEILYNILYSLFSKELIKVNIGYELNSCSVFTINELINAIDCIKSGNLSNAEIIKIIQYYAEI